MSDFNKVSWANRSPSGILFLKRVNGVPHREIGMDAHGRTGNHWNAPSYPELCTTRHEWERRATMKTSEVPRAVAAGMSTASALGLRVDDAVVVHDSNRIAVRLLPCDVLARVAYVAHQAGTKFEVEVARRLAQTDSPVAELEPRVEPCVYV